MRWKRSGRFGIKPGDLNPAAPTFSPLPQITETGVHYDENG